MYTFLNKNYDSGQTKAHTMSEDWKTNVIITELIWKQLCAATVSYTNYNPLFIHMHTYTHTDIQFYLHCKNYNLNIGYLNWTKKVLLKYILPIF